MASAYQDRQGSNAGRGFRYQDAVAAWLCVQVWAGIDAAATIIPEGKDDVECRSQLGTTLIQVKSRREHLGPVPPSEARSFLQELWRRHDRITPPPQALQLILERPVAGQTSAGDSGPPIGSLVSGRSESTDCRAAKTSIRLVSSPHAQSVAAIAGRTGCLPIVAQLCFAQLIRRVGALADDNGRRHPDEYLGMSMSDTDRIITDTLKVVDATQLEVAISSGICEPVDFLAPLDEPRFYQGVDVQPGHVVAGLVVPQISARHAVSDGLEGLGAVLIVGPSGAGKSAIMWDCAHALRHTVRWYRLCRLDPRDLPIIRQFLTSLCVDSDCPVGLVVDDVGRRGTDAWDALTREFLDLKGGLLLGSIREEDLFLIEGRARAVEVRAEPSEETAARVFDDLKSRQRTTWAGWKEAWVQSQGLMLEYVHILSAGRRFTNTLSDQVSARRRDPARSIELAVLRVLAMTSAVGALADPNRLTSALGASEEDVGRGLVRLIDEHLIRKVGNDQLGGLHQLRSAELVHLTHQVSPPSIDLTFSRALEVVLPDGMENLVSDGLRNLGVNFKPAMKALTAFIVERPDIDMLSGVLRGLGSFHIASSIDQWLGMPRTRTLKPTQIGLATLLRHTNGMERLNETLGAALDAADDLKEISADPSKDPRTALLSALPSGMLEDLIATADIVSLNRFLSSQLALELDPRIYKALAEHPLDLMNEQFADVTEFLGTLTALDRGLAIELVEAVGEQTLLSRVPREIPWATSVDVVDEPEGRIARCGHLYIQHSSFEQTHRVVVGTCQSLLALSPRSEIAECQARWPNGQGVELDGFALAHKRIPRSNLPTSALPLWNRRWDEAAARRTAAPSYTDYLNRANAGLDRLGETLNPVLNALLRGKHVKQTYVDALGDVYLASEQLTPPFAGAAAATGRGTGEANRHVSPLQCLLHSCSADLLRRFRELPKNARITSQWLADLLVQHRRAVSEEPWELVGSVPASLIEIGKSLNALHLLAAESSHTGLHPGQAHRGLLNSMLSGRAIHRVAENALQRAERARFRVTEDLRQAMKEDGFEAEVHSVDNPSSLIPWPGADLAVLVSIDTLDDINYYLEATVSARNACPDLTPLTALPVVSGIALPQLANSVQSGITANSEQGWRWVERLGLPASPSKAWSAVSEAASYAMSLNSMDGQGLGLVGRPKPEQVCRGELEKRLASAKLRIEQVVAPLGLRLIDDARAHVQRCRKGELATLLSASFGEQLPGASYALGSVLRLRSALEQAELETLRDKAEETR